MTIEAAVSLRDVYWRGRLWDFLPPLSSAIACGPIWPWLWGRWFGVGGEALQGGLFVIISCGIVTRLAMRGRNRVPFSPHVPSLFAAILFVLSAGLLFRSIPRLLSAALYFSALYWSIQAVQSQRERRDSAALWPMLILSLPYEPSVQFVFGYPMRVLAARFAAAILPGNVHTVGCALSDGVLEVFVDAPCAGVGMLSGMLLLAAGAALIFRLDWLKTAFLMAFGLLCALSSNALRAAILYSGYAGIFKFKPHQYESATGLSCFAASAIFLALAAHWLRGNRKRKIAANDRRDERQTTQKTSFAKTVVFVFLASCLFTAAAGAYQRRPADERAPETPILWPEFWEGRKLTPASASPETELFWRNFPGTFREFIMQPASEVEDGWFPEESRLALRFVWRATRQLHPAEDCFRGAGYKITPAPLLLDENGRAWSGFIAEKSGRAVNVRQCVISVPGGDLRRAEYDVAKSWPDVSSWYWDVARPTGEAAAALAVTVMGK